MDNSAALQLGRCGHLRCGLDGAHRCSGLVRHQHRGQSKKQMEKQSKWSHLTLADRQTSPKTWSRRRVRLEKHVVGGGGWESNREKRKKQNKDSDAMLTQSAASQRKAGNKRATQTELM